MHRIEPAQSTKNRWREIANPVLFALLAAVLATGVRWLLNPWLLYRQPYVFVLPATLIVGMRWGFWPGILCLTVAHVADVFFFEEPIYDLQVADYGGLVSSVVAALLILVAAVMQRRAQAVAQLRAAELAREVDHRIRTEEALRHSNDLQRLLLQELDHRVRNNLASLMSLIQLSTANTRDPVAMIDALRSRVRAIVTAHQMLSKQHWSGVDLEQLFRAILGETHAHQVQIQGPAVIVPSQQVAAMGMVIQELHSNSIKYGALKTDRGRVSVDWQILSCVDEGHTDITLHWQERGGPLVTHGGTPGLGTNLMSGLVRSELAGSAELRYPSSGADHLFHLRIRPVDERWEQLPLNNRREPRSAPAASAA